MVQYTVGQRVKCLATHFDDGPDKDGKLYSERHLKDTNSTWVYGVVKKKLKAGRNMCKVLCDGDSCQMKSSGTHLQAHTVLDDAGGDSSDDDDDEDANSDQEEEGDDQEDDGMTAGPSGGGMTATEIEAEEATAHLTPVRVHRELRGILPRKHGAAHCGPARQMPGNTL